MGGPQHVRLQPSPGFGEWHHYAVTWDGQEVQFYLDGNAIGSTALTDALQANTEPLMIGCDPPGQAEYFNGKLDEIRIYNRALSEAEIQQLVDADGGGVPAFVKLDSPRGGSESFSMAITGEAGQVYEVQSSTNLSTWKTEAMVTNVTGAVPFSTPVPSSTVQQYYRAKLK